MKEESREAEERNAGEGQGPAQGAELGEGERVLSLEEATEILGISKPTLYRWLDEGRIKGRKAGRQWRFYERDVRAVLEDGGAATEALRGLRKLLSALKKEALQEELVELGSALENGRTPKELAQAFVRLVMAMGVNRQAQDVQLQPTQAGLNVRFRNVVSWWPVLSAPAKGPALAAIATCVKGMTGMDEGQRRLPQDGRCHAEFFGRSIDFRTNTFPGVFGEDVCMRILDSEVMVPPLGEIGFVQEQEQAVREVLQASEGLILVVGPTNSGKTTLLYSMLKELNTPDRNVMTVEDPVELTIPGLSQAQLDEAAGYGFATALRGIFRHAPDVVMLGEIRDPETALTLCKGGLIGHLCLSTLHALDTVKTITRLRDMGIPDFLIADALRLVVAPRVVPAICPECKQPHTPEPALLRQLGVCEEGAFRRGAGCDACHGTGFSGARMFCEVLPMTGEIRDKVKQGAPEKQLKRAAGDAGMVALKELGIGVAREGAAALEDVARVVG